MDCIRLEGRAYIGGRFVRVKIGGGDCRLVQLSNKYLILPGMVDLHVHFRDWGLSHKETLEGGARAALAGGVVAVGDMPNTSPHIRTAELYRKRVEQGSGLPILYRLHMGVPEEVAELDRARPRSVKIYPEDVASFGWQHVERLAERCASLGCFLIFHCEDPSYFKNSERPPEAEVACVERVRQIAHRTGVRVHLTHITLPYTAEATRGWASVDVTPHHLLLDMDNCKDPALCLVNPRLRTPEIRRGLLAALASGLIDMYATDHAPHTLEEKRSGNPPPGICSLDIALSLLLSLWKRGIVSLDDVVRLYSFRPSRLLGVDIDTARGSFAVVKLEEFEIRGGNFAGSCKFTPFEKFKAFGMVEATAVRGKIYFKNGEVYSLQLAL
ncbi:Dihydroorotase-related cyclic amidohydrolase [Pyrobaculum oguniense TE7]|uniref:Dihydroorotase-related cyclic amidohydrolase n=1 Tax=Pyrobaculum oguniense (strain DSM 13380 / JCM 10595 / TE7) TaxID=698757 RepID=H6QBX7_PYROT|nr:Dihydroorotase-related cyclic amidohydrolase [Pyrobaculum oguniense TE7]